MLFSTGLRGCCCRTFLYCRNEILEHVGKSVVHLQAWIAWPLKQERGVRMRPQKYQVVVFLSITFFKIYL